MRSRVLSGDTPKNRDPANATAMPASAAVLTAWVRSNLVRASGSEARGDSCIAPIVGDRRRDLACGFVTVG